MMIHETIEGRVILALKSIADEYGLSFLVDGDTIRYQRAGFRTVAKVKLSFFTAPKSQEGVTGSIFVGVRVEKFTAELDNGEIQSLLIDRLRAMVDAWVNEP